MYNSHRGIPPGPPPPQPNRVVELLDQVRAEFEAQIGRTNDTEHHRKSTLCT
jgi:glucose repression regulatory protein TUP1